MITNEDIREMFENDPEHAEELAQQGINDWIDQYEDETKKKRLRALHWNINHQVKDIKDPVARMNKMVEIFWDGFMDFHQVMLDHHEFLNYGTQPPLQTQTQNVVSIFAKGKK